MRIISNRALRDFAASHPGADAPLQGWRKVVEQSRFTNFAALRQTFNSVDRVGGFYVFDVGGNKFRIVAAIHFNSQILFVRHVFTHAQYDRWKP